MLTMRKEIFGSLSQFQTLSTHIHFYNNHLLFHWDPFSYLNTTSHLQKHINNSNLILQSKPEEQRQTRPNSSWIESKEMYSQSDQLPVHSTTCSVLMVKPITNGETSMPDSTHTKNQETIGSLNPQAQDIGPLNQLQIPITSCLDFKMKEMATNSVLEHIHLSRIETSGQSMDSMDEYYI